MYTYIRETIPENDIDLILDLLNPAEHRYVFYLTILHTLIGKLFKFILLKIYPF